MCVCGGGGGGMLNQSLTGREVENKNSGHTYTLKWVKSSVSSLIDFHLISSSSVSTTSSLCATVTVCVCVWVCTRLCYFFGTFPSVNTDLVRTSGPHGDQSSVLMRLNGISGVLVKFRVRNDLVMVKVRDKVLIRPYTMNENTCKVPESIAVQTRVYVCVCVGTCLCVAVITFVLHLIISPVDYRHHIFSLKLSNIDNDPHPPRSERPLQR